MSQSVRYWKQRAMRAEGALAAAMIDIDRLEEQLEERPREARIMRADFERIALAAQSVHDLEADFLTERAARYRERAEHNDELGYALSAHLDRQQAKADEAAAERMAA